LLTGLIERGSAQNLDVRTAIERTTAAEAALGRVGLDAQFNGDFDATVTRQNVGDGLRSRRRAGIDGSYLLDMFGEVENRQTQVVANLDAAQLNVGAVNLAYLADITSAYLQARYFQEAATITRTTIRSHRQTLRLVLQRRDAGEATELDVQQARAQLAISEARLPSQTANFETSVFRIATLVAEPAQPILTKMEVAAFQPYPSDPTLVGQPADLLRNRPDVQIAEQNLIAAAAEIGIAQAQLLPSISINGTLETGTGGGWSFGPKLNIPVFNRGALQANQEIAESKAREAELRWRATVLRAVEDVQTALSYSQNWSEQVAHLKRARVASATVLDLSQRSYRSGAIPLTDVLNAERQHAINRLSAADAVRNYALSWMELQIATGQGWSPTAITPTQ
jgi:multidrug efflux system outer membrane protein